MCVCLCVFVCVPSRLGSDNMYACIDEVTDRIQRKLRRFKERKVKETRGRSGVAALSDKVCLASLYFSSFFFV